MSETDQINEFLALNPWPPTSTHCVRNPKRTGSRTSSGPAAKKQAYSLLSEVLSATGLTAETLSAALRVSPETLKRWKTGSRPNAPQEEQLKFIRSLCKAFPVEPTRMRSALLQGGSKSVIGLIAAQAPRPLIISALAEKLGVLPKPGVLTPKPGVLTGQGELIQVTPLKEPVRYLDIRSGKVRQTF